MADNGHDQLIEDINRLVQNQKIYVAATNTVLAAQKKRIFQDGKDSAQSKIGVYGTKPISIAKKDQAKQTGQTYFKGGYREYKSLLGKGGGSFVNLRNTDQMMFDLSTVVVSQKEFGIGFQNKFNGDKKEWLETKYNKQIFATTPEEDELFVNVINYEIDKL